MKVPPIDKPYIISFCQSICPESKGIYVPVDPLPNKPINECFSIVPEYITSNGGEQKIGWAIWYWPGVFIEAEFHCIWESPDGHLVDITPKQLPTINQILFLPDPTRHYEGRQVDNIRKPISQHPLINQYIALAERYYRETNKGDLANQHGYIIVPDKVRKIEEKMQKIGLALIEKFGSPF